MREPTLVVLGTAFALTMSGCASSTGETAATARGEMKQDRVIAEQQARIDNLTTELRDTERELDQARSARAQDAASAMPAKGQLFPPNAKPGLCYARVLVPGEFREQSERVMLSEASARLEIIPAKYETVTERVLTREASTRLEVVPARYQTVEERILIQPETTRIEEIPASYKIVTDRILVSPARTEWKRGAAARFADVGNVVESRETDTGEVMCLVEIPAQYRTVERKVVDQPARTREIKVPAQYKMVKKTVLAQPATTREVTIPAEYGTVQVTRLVTPAREREIKIPAKYGTVSKRVQVSEDRLEWREVLCEINMTPENVRTLQASLRDKGFDAGPVDGILGTRTLSGARAFAKANGLPSGSGYITMQVANKLGIKR